MDKDRPCAAECRAFNDTHKSCKFLDRSATIVSSFKVLMRWLGERSPPSVR